MKGHLPEHVEALSCSLSSAWCTLPLEGRDACQRAVAQQVARCLNHARRYWPALPEPEVRCDLKGRSAGQAHFGHRALRFNMELLMAQPQAFIEDVVPHEVAHWVDVYGVAVKGKPHGPVWRWLMVHLYGRMPRVTHHFDTSATTPTPWHYGCQCEKGHWLTVHRHRRIERGYAYRCRRCGHQLRLLGCEPKA